MSKRFFAISVTLLFAFVGASSVFAGAKINMQEGRWEITSEVKMPGMSLPPATHTQCITKSDLVPQKSQPGQECSITDVEINGNTVTWTMICSGGGGDVTGTGRITYSGDRFSGAVRMNMPGGSMQVTTQMEGRRIGECR